MTGADRPPAGGIRPAVVRRYPALARAARAGQQVTDCEPGAFEEGGFGAAGYADVSGLPDGAVRASLGCGNPVAVADLRPGDTVLDLGSGGGIDVLLSARRVGPGGRAYGLDASATCSPWRGRTRSGPARATRSSCTAGSRRSRCLTVTWTSSSPTAWSTCPATSPASWPRRSACCVPAGGWAISDMIAEDGHRPASGPGLSSRPGA